MLREREGIGLETDRFCNMFFFFAFRLEEVWRAVPGYNGRYLVSNIGRVKQLSARKNSKWGNKQDIPERILTQVITTHGYLRVTLFDINGVPHKYLSHRLVASAFISNTDNLPQINHINEDKTDNRIENLEWSTASHNVNWGTRNARVAEKLERPLLGIRIKDGKILKFRSIVDARKQGYSPVNISKHDIVRTIGSCRCDEYIWRWEDDPDTTMPTVIDRRKKIMAISIINKEVIEFESLHSAHRSGFGRNSVKLALRKGKSYKGYYWSYR